MNNAELSVFSDTDNSGEGDNAYIKFSQDGDAIRAYAGFEGSAGTLFTNSLQNAFVVGSRNATSEAPVQFIQHGAVAMTIDNDHNVGIQTNTPNYELDVHGTIRAEEVIVELFTPDYVFRPGFDLMTLDEVESYVKEGKIPNPPAELDLAMKEQAGVFVSIKKHGVLRGCIGTFEPTKVNVAEEIIANAISSATRDPRFTPVDFAELPHLEYRVDVLTKPESVEGPDQLDPKKYGVIVESGWQRGLLLPDLEMVDTVEQQIEICRQKAGILPHEPIKLYRFEVKRY